MFKQICHRLTLLNGWKFQGEIPADLKSFVVVGAPHTSNWDFFPAMSLMFLLNRNVKFIMKKSWLKFPMNLLLENMGALGIDRDSIQNEGQSNTTDTLSELFKTHKNLALMISPEGTRKPNENWKTGFYYIAKKAGVPIVLVFADYEKKIAGVGKIIYPDDYDKDMQTITDFFKDKKGKNQSNFKLDKRFKQS